MTLDARADAAEAQIDRACLEQPLLRRPRSAAVFQVLTAAEDLLAFANKIGGPHQRAIALDNIVNALKYAMLWITQATDVRSSGTVPAADLAREATALLKLANSYTSVFAAYSYARHDVIHLSLAGNTLRATGPLLDDTRYEAYSLLLTPGVERDALSTDEHDTDVIGAIKSAWQRGVKFTSLPTARAVVKAAYAMMERDSGALYVLPNHWRFASFSLSDFRAVHTAIRAVLYVWKRIAVVLKGQIPSGASLPFVVSKRELFSVIRDVTGLARQNVRSVVTALEYGGAGIEVPDPALQPLIALDVERYALSAPIVLGTAAERNLAVLLNMIPAERSAYSSLVNEKEDAMFSRIAARVPSWASAWRGRLPGRPDLPDVDLALVDEQHGVLLLVELKWFVDPAEVREILRRSQELAKGVRQCHKLLNAHANSPEVFTAIPGAPFVDAAAIVVSANWIGHADVQDTAISILNEEHFLQKLASTQTLADLLHWLRARKYLPVEGEHFKTTARIYDISAWVLEWYGLDPLLEDPFLPL